MGENGWRTFWAYAGTAAVVTAVLLPLFAYRHLHGPLPSHIDFGGNSSGQGSAAPIFVFAAIALIDGAVLAVLYLRDAEGKRFPAAFWFFVATALWWLAGAEANFVAVGLAVNGIPWGAVNGVFLAAFVLGVLLLLRSARSSL